MILPRAQRFSFAARPVPVPADLRINWRLSLIIIMLGESRAKRASLAKLHVLNDAVRSPATRTQLQRILSGLDAPLNLQLRVEPAFARAIDFVVGERFADWTRAAQRAALQLTKQGLASWMSVKSIDDALVDEKAFLQDVSKRLTEDFVSRLISGRRNS